MTIEGGRNIYNSMVHQRHMATCTSKKIRTHIVKRILNILSRIESNQGFFVDRIDRQLPFKFKQRNTCDMISR